MLCETCVHGIRRKFVSGQEESFISWHCALDGWEKRMRFHLSECSGYQPKAKEIESQKEKK